MVNGSIAGRRRQASAAGAGAGITGVIDAIDEGVIAVDDGWRITYANGVAAYLLGLDASALLGQSLLPTLGLASETLFAPDGRPAAGFSACCERPGAWLELRGHAHAGGGLVFLRDVSYEREQQRAGLEQARQREAQRSINERLFDTSLDLILVTDRQGNLLRVSPSSESILGYAPAAMIGSSAARFIHADDLAGTRAEMRAARRGQVMRRFEGRYRHKDGSAVPLNWTCVWSAADAQHVFIGRDMTERLAAEGNTQRSQRLEAIGQLTGGIAHDFNNMLSLVISSLELMLDREDLASDTAEHAAAALHGAQRGADLVRGLLAFARQQPVQPRLVDVNALLGNTVRLLGRMLGGDIAVAFAGAADPWPVRIDAPHFESAIVNLAVNARDAMEDGGRLTISTHNVTIDAGQCDDPGLAGGDYVVVTAADTGSGIPPELLERVFNPFFTTKAPGKGTGLGLSMVFDFVRQSGGQIRIDSVPDSGTSVRLYLPRATACMREASSDDTDRSQPSARRRERILVVEDNAAVRQLVVAQLHRLGYATMEAERASAALALLDSGEPFDLLFTDIVMPGGVGGPALAREASTRRDGLKVLFTSGLPGALVQAEGIDGSHRVLAKPYRIDALARQIREALDG